ncbi:MAG: Gfo/Idh/MocA family protein [Sedimentisphaeraceae bacterium JB056]
MREKINIGVIGCGMLARMQHIPNIVKSQRMVLHTCCDISDEALSECKQIHGALHISKNYEEVIANPEIDVLCVATTEKLRLPVIDAAAKAGKPVYCEKPLARTLEEMYEIQKIVKQAGIPFCIGHNRRSSPAMLDAHRIFRNHMDNPKTCKWRFIRDGASKPALPDDGKAAMTIRINDDWYSWKSWVFDKQQAPFGPMLFEMTHFTDICNWFLDAEPEEVVAMEQGMLNHSVIVKYKTGELANLFLCANGTLAYPKELYEAFGNGAAVVVDHMLEIRTAGIEDAPSIKKYPMLGDRHQDIGTEGGLTGWLKKKQAACRQVVESNKPMDFFTAEPDKGHAHALERFMDQIEAAGSVVCDVDDAVMATRVAFAAIMSARENRVIKLSEI